ncbi:MAG: amino acid permease [Planctomycetota bacterium]|nr:MAG: amino acid permease [Planctomycetota bacterium]
MKKELSVFDSTCIIVGIIIGAGIYETAPAVASSVSGWWGVLGLWAFGGLLSLAGALCYAELATAYPYDGGDYVYLSRAYGRWAGFLFGWVQLVVVRPGYIALVAFVFARYAGALLGPVLIAESSGRYSQVIYAGAAVLILTIVNILGVREGKWTQNILTIIKVAGLAAILVAALTGPPASATDTQAEVSEPLPVSAALILILFTFGGWNEVAYVAAEVKNPRRNILRSVLAGMAAVTVLYLLANVAFLRALGHAGMANSEAVASDMLEAAFPRFGGRIISALICISALGTVNGLIFTGSRISYAVGAEHRLFRLLGRWDEQRGTPVWALVLQGGIALAMIVVLGSFRRTILYTAAAVYAFYLATSVSVIILRWKEPDTERPYKVTGYPLTTIVFGACCALLVYSALVYNLRDAAICCAILLGGVPVYWLSNIGDSGGCGSR